MQRVRSTILQKQQKYNVWIHWNSFTNKRRIICWNRGYIAGVLTWWAKLMLVNGNEYFLVSVGMKIQCLLTLAHARTIHRHHHSRAQRTAWVGHIIIQDDFLVISSCLHSRVSFKRARAPNEWLDAGTNWKITFSCCFDVWHQHKTHIKKMLCSSGF